jgi:hypothetical protein
VIYISVLQNDVSQTAGIMTLPALQDLQDLDELTLQAE